jgi:hypothetical protein
MRGVSFPRRHERSFGDDASRRCHQKQSVVVFFFAAIAAVAYTARVCETSIAGTTGITAYKVEGMIRNASRLMFQHQDEINDAVTVTFL